MSSTEPSRPLAGGELLDLENVPGQIEERTETESARLGRGLRNPVQDRHHLQILPAGQGFEGGAGFGDVPRHSLDPDRILLHVNAVDLGRPGGRQQHAGQDLDGCRFPRTVRTHRPESHC